MTQHPLDEMKSYIGYDDADDAALLDLWTFVKPEVHRIIDHFYERILAFPDAVAVLQSPAQVERLKQTLRGWLEELLVGPHDHAYYERRKRIGTRHVEVGLPPQYMFTAMAVMQQDLCEVALQTLDRTRSAKACAAVGKIASIELSVMTGTFIQRREERQLSTMQDLIVSHMPVTLLLLDAGGLVTSATRPGVRLFGSRAMQDRHVSEALPQALVAASRLEDHIARALATGREITLLRVDAEFDDRVRSFRLTVVPLDHPKARVLLHIEELTDTVETEARLRKSETLAQLGALSAAVAHELRNPLAGISGAIQVIARSLPDDDRRRPVMEKVEQQIQRLNALVTDLLAFARPDVAKLVDVDVGELVRSVGSLFLDAHPGAIVEVNGQLRARADSNYLHQVILNLVENAVQAQDGAGIVRVDLSDRRIVVADAGPGVPAALREEIFQPFFTTRTRGTGLGLAISRKLCRAMGARLELLPDGPLGGAAFVVEFETPGS